MKEEKQGKDGGEEEEGRMHEARGKTQEAVGVGQCVLSRHHALLRNSTRDRRLSTRKLYILPLGSLT